MTSRKVINESTKRSQERIAEVAWILCIGIKRLKDREESKNGLNQLDYNTDGSLHNTDSNPNQKTVL